MLLYGCFTTLCQLMDTSFDLHIIPYTSVTTRTNKWQSVLLLPENVNHIIQIELNNTRICLYFCSVYFSNQGERHAWLKRNPSNTGRQKKIKVGFGSHMILENFMILVLKRCRIRMMYMNERGVIRYKIRIYKIRSQWNGTSDKLC